MYYTAEMQNTRSASRPEWTNAKTLAAAKAVASKRQTFRGAVLAIYNRNGHKIAVKDARGWFHKPDEAPLNCAPDFDPE